MGAAWLDWIYRALVLLVVACPCALVISTPVSIVSGLAAAARHGILIKGGVYLEEGRKLRWLALDKTGTITHGKPAQTDFVTWGNALASDSRSIAASLAARSDHPVSKAVAQAAQTDGVALLDVAEFNALPGRGVQGQINGATYHLGNHRMLEELGQCTPELEQRIAALETAGKTVVMLVGAKAVHALFAVADTIKDSSRTAIAELHALGINTMMLTGDNPIRHRPLPHKPESTVRKATYSQMTNCAKWSNWPEAARLAWSVMASTMPRPWRVRTSALQWERLAQIPQSRPPTWP